MKRVSLILVVALVAALTGTVFGSMYGEHFGFPIAKLKLNGQEVTPPAPAIVVDGTTYVPLRFVANAMGAGIGWNSDTETVSINFEPKPAQPQPPYKTGDTVPVGNFKVTVNGVRTATTSDNPYIKPKDGNMWVIADVTIQNTSQQNEIISSLAMFKIADTQGYNYSVSLGADTKAQLEGTLAAGRTMRGEVGFEVAKTVPQPLELIFTSSMFQGSQAVFALK